jgi:leader peptidase (prepilin peptidase)/N-methyltransferase
VAIDPQSAIWLAAVLGLAVGGCLAALVRRLPRVLDDDWDKAWPRLWRIDRACLTCGRPIRGWRGAPVLGWLSASGGCGACRAPMAARSVLIASMTAVLFALCAWRFGPGYTALCAMVLVAALLALAWIDAQTGLLPDIITLPLMWAGLLVNTLHTFASPVDAILGAAAGYLFLWIIYQVFRLLTGREGMGYGDFKLLAALGAWLGLPALPAVLIAASLTGVLVGLALILARRIKRNQPQPFGPYLALAGIVGLLTAGLHIG